MLSSTIPFNLHKRILHSKESNPLHPRSYLYEEHEEHDYVLLPQTKDQTLKYTQKLFTRWLFSNNFFVTYSLFEQKRWSDSKWHHYLHSLLFCRHPISGNSWSKGSFSKGCSFLGRNQKVDDREFDDYRWLSVGKRFTYKHVKINICIKDVSITSIKLYSLLKL